VARIVWFGFGVLGFVALVWIPFRSMNGAGLSLANCLSCFTIESYPSLLLGLAILAVVFALLAAAVLLAGRLAARRA
jgi:hypothetical protein